MIGHDALLVTVSRILVAPHAECRGEDRRKIEQPGERGAHRASPKRFSRGLAAGSLQNEVANPCQTGAFGQMSGRRCFSVRDRATCSIKLWPR